MKGMKGKSIIILTTMLFFLLSTHIVTGSTSPWQQAKVDQTQTIEDKTATEENTEEEINKALEMFRTEGRYYRKLKINSRAEISGIYPISEEIAKKEKCYYFKEEHLTSSTVIEYLKKGKLRKDPLLGVARIVEERSEEDKNIVIQKYFDPKGKRIKNKDKVFQTEFVLGDNSDYPVAVYFYNENGDWINDRDGIGKISMIRDEDGNIFEERYLNNKGELIIRKDMNIAITRFKSDSNRNITEMQFFDSDEKNTTENSTGVSIIRYKYDERDNIIEESYHDENGNLKISKEFWGAAMYRYKYDAHGNRIEMSLYGTSGKPKDCTWWEIGIVRWRYDDRGNLLYTDYLDKRGRPLTP
ncbi:MAG: hypothetical protein ABH868_01305 [bacterium]